jgi:hypothetical protein
MATIDIPERTLLKLTANAKARNVPLDVYLETVAEADATKSAKQLAAVESFAQGMSNWVEKNLPPGHVVDDSRESIYPDRD